jgi:uncharacterized protein with HEPN domain
MSRNLNLYLQDILECCQNIREYVGSMTFAEFSADTKTIDAVVRNLEIVGESVKQIPPELLEIKPQINWKQIARFRDIIVHRYFKVDMEIVWDILQNRLPELEKAVREISSSLPQNP